MEDHPPPSSPAELLDRARGGDLVALGQLVEEMRQEFVRAVRMIVGGSYRHRSEPEDLVQECLTAALRSIRDLRARDLRGFRAWFLAIARHRMLVLRRNERARVRPRHSTPLPASHVALQDPSELDVPPSDDAGSARQDHAQELGPITRVKADHRVAVVLHDVFDARWTIVAFVLDRTTPEAARQVHLRARQACAAT